MEKSDTFQCYLHSNKGPKLFNKVEYLQNELSLIKANKESVIRVSRKEWWIVWPDDPKAYWSILKSFLNNKKISCIPSLFNQNRCITKYKDKA